MEWRVLVIETPLLLRGKPLQKRLVRGPMLTEVICINVFPQWLVHEMPCSVGRPSRTLDLELN